MNRSTRRTRKLVRKKTKRNKLSRNNKVRVRDKVKSSIEIK